MKTKTLIMLLAAALAVVSLSSPSHARRGAGRGAGDDKTTKPKKRRGEPTTRKKHRLRGMHARMAKVCNLSKQQQKQIAELNTLRQKAMKQFRAENGEKFRTLKAKIAEAKKNKDKKAMKEAMAQRRSLHRKQREIYSQWQPKIMAVLTPEQKVKWDRDQVVLSIKRQFRKAKLTDKQTVDVKAACAKFTTGVDLSDKKARRKAVKKLADYISKEILTDAQRAATTRAKRKTTTKPADSTKSPKVKKPA